MQIPQNSGDMELQAVLEFTTLELQAAHIHLLYPTASVRTGAIERKETG